MTDETPIGAKRASRSIGRIPFGSPTLDGRFSGIPAGSSVLLCGAPDAGTDAYAHTHAASLMTARYYPGMYDGRITTPDILPEKVHYVTVDRTRSHLLHEMDSVLGARRFNTLTEHLHIEDFSDRFLDLTPMPPSLRQAARGDTTADDGPSERDDATFDSFLGEVSDYLVSVGDDNMVVFDSLTALNGARAFGLSQADILGFLSGIRSAAESWGGIVSVLHHARPEVIRADEIVNTALHGCLYFYTNDSGTNAQKTMRIGEFGGALSRRRQVVYDTQVTDSGFSISSNRRV
ncbi:RAD55 family ATPase [Halomarina oriensis]|uniref:Chemotaxis protein CheY n=1 Tax=Halomarina oriensis TaxID=671145 RepID=A0A6B0GXC5_9EURY|nr:chemotaxis protein CheY [Halomarina oriensis]MWG36418.1 chemotaxis protein CheY [Halomarina oriensis]